MINLDPEANGSIYCVYLLKSCHIKYKNSYYIGFTNNPNRRIKQHNGVLDNGAAKTKRKRPWNMILFIYGFPTKHSALQFEWAWQHPKVSRFIKHKIKNKRFHKPSNGILKQLQILFIMINSLPWKNYPLAINFTKKEFHDIYEEYKKY